MDTRAHGNEQASIRRLEDELKNKDEEIRRLREELRALRPNFRQPEYDGH